MKKITFMACMLLSALAGFSQGIDVSKVYAIKNYNTSDKGECFIQDNGNASVGVNTLNDNSYWVFESAGVADHYYIKNYKTDNYLQAYTISNNAVVSAGGTKAEYVVAIPSGKDYYGIALADQTNTSFSDAACKGLNFNSGDMIAQAFEAKAGTNMKSFWYLVEKGSIHDHSYTNGVCSVSGCLARYQPAVLNNGVYELTNAGNVEWFGQKVAYNGNNVLYNAKLMNDIDFEDIEHSPIGPTTGRKYQGVFDGQGYRILNMIINQPSKEVQGFFGWLQGSAATTIRNLIIDSTCSITGSNKCGGVAGASQNTGGLITIENVVNEANVIVTGQDAAGIVGGESGDKATFAVRNVVNKGNITSTHIYPYAGALFCYQEKGTVENFLNLGTITGHDGGNIGRFNGTKINIVDLSATTSRTQGVVDGLTTDDIASGKLAWYFNSNDNQDDDAFFQTIGTDAYPMPFAKEGAVVYRTGSERCDHADIAATVYSNTSGSITTAPHDSDAATGFCNVCSNPDPNFKNIVDGAYELGNHYDLSWFAAMVNTGNPAINGRLTADIDMSEVDYTPIGTNTKRYSGTFDGKGHKVELNIDANAYGQGFISIATGGATIKNLVVTGNVKNEGSKTAGIIAEAIGGGTITIQNCGNEATIEGAGGEVAAIVANNWGYQCTLNLENVYNIGDVSGTGDVSTICACQGNGSSIFKNVYNKGNVTGAAGGNFVRLSYGTYTNCYSTTLTGNDNASIIPTDASKVASGELCAKLGYGFRQTVGTGYPCFNQALGFVNQITAAGYSTQYNTYSDVEIPDGIEAFAGVKNGTEWLRLIPITENIAKDEPVILRGDAGLYNFMPTTGISRAANNELQGSDGTVSGGSTIYALAKIGEPATIGFYPTRNSYKIPEGRAYLNVPAEVKGFTFVFEDTDDGIRSLTPALSEGEGAIYNVAGQKLSKMQKGINIVNGKKIMK